MCIRDRSGVGYRASKSGDKVVLNLGFSKPCEISPPKGIEIDVPAPTQVIVRGIDKGMVGQIAADIRRLRPVSYTHLDVYKRQVLLMFRVMKDLLAICWPVQAA